MPFSQNIRINLDVQDQSIVVQEEDQRFHTVLVLSHIPLFSLRQQRDQQTKPSVSLVVVALFKV